MARTPSPAVPDFCPAALTAWRGYISAREGTDVSEDLPADELPTRAGILAHQNGDTLESFVLLEAQDVATGHPVASQALEEVHLAMESAISDLEAVADYVARAITTTRDFEQFAASSPTAFAEEWGRRMVCGDISAQAGHLQRIWDRATAAQRAAVPVEGLTPFLTHADAAVRARAVTMAAEMPGGPAAHPVPDHGERPGAPGPETPRRRGPR